jgi:hypothetical protein
VETIRAWLEGFLRGRYGFGGRRAFEAPASDPSQRRLHKPTVVVAVAVVVVALYGLFVLWYHNPLVPSPPPLVASPEPRPAEGSVIVPTPPGKTLLESRTKPEGE